MKNVHDIFDAYTLERMITEFTWTVLSDPLLDNLENGNDDYVYQKYLHIFLQPHFLVNDSDKFKQVDIKKVHEEYSRKFLVDKAKKPDKSTQNPTNSLPRSLDYQDNRLSNAPSNISEHIINKKMIEHECFINIMPGRILFDSNFEQLTLIMNILDHSLEFHPLLHDQHQFDFAAQLILPRFSTYSYSFSFSLEVGYSHIIPVEDHSRILIDLLATTTGNNNPELGSYYELEDYKGIYFSISKKSADEVPNHYKLNYEVTPNFTNGAMLLDRSSIQKTSLILLDNLLGKLELMEIPTKNEISALREGLSPYLT